MPDLQFVERGSEKDSVYSGDTVSNVVVLWVDDCVCNTV